VYLCVSRAIGLHRARVVPPRRDGADRAEVRGHRALALVVIPQTDEVTIGLHRREGGASVGAVGAEGTEASQLVVVPRRDGADRAEVRGHRALALVVPPETDEVATTRTGICQDRKPIHNRNTGAHLRRVTYELSVRCKFLRGPLECIK